MNKKPSERNFKDSLKKGSIKMYQYINAYTPKNQTQT